MELSTLPGRPIRVTSLKQLPGKDENIDYAIPITVSEIPVTGVADLALSFVIRLSTCDWYAYVYDRASSEWREVHDGGREGASERDNCFDRAAEAITDYWTEHAQLDGEFTLDQPRGKTGGGADRSILTDGR